MLLRWLHTAALAGEATRELWLHNNRIGRTGVHALFEAYAAGALPVLEKLRLVKFEIPVKQWNENVDDGWREIRLVDVNLTDLDLVFMAPLLRFRGVLQQVQQLELTHNSIGDMGLAALAEAFEGSGGSMAIQGAQLKQLSLFNNNVGDPGTEALVSALGALPMLESLNLGSNELGDHSVAHLARAAHNGLLPNLQQLQLRFCERISEEGLKPLAGAIDTGDLPSIMTVYVSEGQFQSHTDNPVAMALRKFRGLRSRESRPDLLPLLL